MHPKLDYPLGTELAIHFNASVTFLLLVLENYVKYHKGDFAGYYIYMGSWQDSKLITYVPASIFIDSYTTCTAVYIWGGGSEKGPIAHIFSSFQIISYSKRHLCPLQLLSYALEISLTCPSCMELHACRVLNF